MSSVNDTSRRGLGRGLEVLIGGAGEAELLHLPVEAVHPNPRQPRRRFEPEATSGLAASIRHQGVLQPVVVRPRPDGGYELIAGERRWRAAREAGVPTIPAVVRNADDRDTLLLGLVENVARENLSPGRRGARLRVADRRVRALARRGGRARGPLEAVGLEPRPPARAAGGRALDARPRRPHRGPRPGGAGAAGRRRAPAPGAEDHPGRAHGPRRREGGPGRRRPPPPHRRARSTRRSPSAPASPPTASPGSRPRSTAASSSSSSRDETGLAELVEVLEALL